MEAQLCHNHLNKSFNSLILSISTLRSPGDQTPMASPVPTNAITDCLSVTHRNIYHLAILPDHHCIFQKFLRLAKNELDEYKGISELAPHKWAQKNLHKQQLVTCCHLSLFYPPWLTCYHSVTIWGSNERLFPSQNVKVTLKRWCCHSLGMSDISWPAQQWRHKQWNMC